MNFSLDINWQSVASGPEWQRHMFAVFIGFILTIAALYFCIMPERNNNQVIRQQVMVAQKISASYRQKLTDLPRINELKEQIEMLKGRQDIHRYYPSATSTLTKAIVHYISSSGGQLIDLKRDSGSAKTAGIIIHRWRLTMKVTYFQFIDFIKLIGREVPLLAIDNLVVRAESGLLNLSIGLSLYQLKMGD